jgi:hypothetical protein
MGTRILHNVMEGHWLWDTKRFIDWDAGYELYVDIDLCDLRRLRSTTRTKQARRLSTCTHIPD